MPLNATTGITLGGVNVWDEDTEEHFGRDRSSNYAIRTMRCNWTDRATLVNYFRGGSVQIGLVIIISPSLQYPDAPGLYVDTVDVDGEGVKSVGVNGMVAYQRAAVRVRYAALDFGDIVTGETQVELEFGKEVVSFPRESLQLEGGIPLDQGQAFSIPVVGLRKSMTNLPRLPINTILNSSEKPVNLTPIFGAPPGTVIFDGGRSLLRWSLSAGWQFDVVYNCIYKSVGWVKVLDSTGTWKKVQTRAGTDILQRSDLNQLFNKNAP